SHEAPCEAPASNARGSAPRALLDPDRFPSLNGGRAAAWLPSNAAHAEPAANARDVVLNQRLCGRETTHLRSVHAESRALERLRCPAPLWCAVQVLMLQITSGLDSQVERVVGGLGSTRARARASDSCSTPLPLRSAARADLLNSAGSCLRSAPRSGCPRFRAPPVPCSMPQSPLAQPERELSRRRPHTQSHPRMRGTSCVRGVRQQPSRCRELRTCAPCPPYPACAVHQLASRSLRAVPLHLRRAEQVRRSQMVVAVK
ncbi:hypothetical protein B0H15DRAFT_818538, partial [Mycena belliarum]